METRSGGQSALYSLLGHKGDLMFVHFRETFDQLNRPNSTGAAAAERIPRADHFLSVGHRAGALRIQPEDLQIAGRARHRAALGRVEEGHRRNDRAAKGGHEAAAVSRDAGQPLPLLLPDEPPARRRQELVHAAHGRAAAADERARHGRPALRGRGASRSSPGRSASTIGSGAWTCLPTIRWCSRSSSTRCASTRSAPCTRCLAISMWGCGVAANRLHELLEGKLP